jgi:hypothetical protein
MIQPPLPYILPGTIAEKIFRLLIIWKRIQKPDRVRKFPILDPVPGPCANRAIGGEVYGFMLFSFASAKRKKIVSHRWRVFASDRARSLAAIAHPPKTTGNEIPGRAGLGISGPGPQNRAYFSGRGHKKGRVCGIGSPVLCLYPCDPPHQYHILQLH